MVTASGYGRDARPSSVRVDDDDRLVVTGAEIVNHCDHSHMVAIFGSASGRHPTSILDIETHPSQRAGDQEPKGKPRSGAVSIGA